jgi:hypothetical protein
MQASSRHFSAEKLRRIDAVLKKKNYPAWVALKHHRTHENKSLDFISRPYLKQIYLDQATYMAIMKCTQSRVSEYLHNRAIAKAITGQSIFYVLPTDRLVYRVVRNRIDREVNYTRLYQAFARSAEGGRSSRQASSMSMKQFGMGTIAFVPSNSSPAFAEYKADEAITDEVDECDPENLVKAWERLGDSEYRTQIKVGNPTVDLPGTISDEYNQTDRKQWNVPCPHCRNEAPFDWFTQVVREVDKQVYVIRDEDWDWENGRDINVICTKCEKPLFRWADGHWIPRAKSERSGYHIDHMFSGKFTIVELLDRFIGGLTNPTKMQRFWNGSLGLPFMDKGAKITTDMLNDCLGEHLSRQKSTVGIGIMGVDVNDTLNVIVGRLLPDMNILVTEIQEMPQSVEALIALALDHGVRVIVLDGLPEQYFVRKVKAKYSAKGYAAFACFYQQPKDDTVDRKRNITVDRTSTLDEVRSIIARKAMRLPADAPAIPDFYDQVTAAVRVWDPHHGKHGAFVWREGTKKDHYHHALNYLVLAAKIVKRSAA